MILFVVSALAVAVAHPRRAQFSIAARTGVWADVVSCHVACRVRSLLGKRRLRQICRTPLFRHVFVFPRLAHRTGFEC